MFGIIAGVLIGVWAMFTVLSDDADVKAATADIQLIQSAAVQYKQANPNNGYRNLGSVNDGGIDPYLGDGLGVETLFGNFKVLTNTFGGTVYITPASSGEDLLVLYGEVPSVNVCLKILQRFGDVEEIEIGGGGGGGAMWPI